MPDAGDRLVKADLIMRITDTIRLRRPTQGKAAALFGIDQPKISRLLRGQVSGFSTERLIQFLTLLGQDVTIVVGPAPEKAQRTGRLSVVLAQAALQGD